MEGDVPFCPWKGNKKGPPRIVQTARFFLGYGAVWGYPVISVNLIEQYPIVVDKHFSAGHRTAVGSSVRHGVRP